MSRVARTTVRLLPPGRDPGECIITMLLAVTVAVIGSILAPQRSVSDRRS
ncbi:MAG: hypothetical protein M3Q54_10830 [Actinomycetota bacterium]|nr:hypothetical protein [Actinomycetota bacterium]